MLPTPESPLSEEQLQALKEAQALLPRLKEEIRRAKLAGIDVSQQEAELAELEGRIQGLLRVYGGTGFRTTRTTSSPSRSG